MNEPKRERRAEVLTQFVKVARKLHELRDLHSLKAVVAALSSLSVNRLELTWALLARRTQERFRKLRELVGEECNREQMRVFLADAHLPCIPYLGIKILGALQLPNTRTTGTSRLFV